MICDDECVHQLTGKPWALVVGRPAAMNDWPWGYCGHCAREVLTKSGVLILHGGVRNRHCPGSGGTPTTPPPELTASQEKAITALAWTEAQKRKGKPWQQ